jgi:hypothetical protein
VLVLRVRRTLKLPTTDPPREARNTMSQLPLRHPVVLAILTSLVACTVMAFWSTRKLTIAFAAPAVVLSTWIFVGHLVTLDDDWPGGWSNTDGSQKVWIASLRDLLWKLVLLVVSLVVVATALHVVE